MSAATALKLVKRDDIQSDSLHKKNGNRNKTNAMLVDCIVIMIRMDKNRFLENYIKSKNW